MTDGARHGARTPSVISVSDGQLQLMPDHDRPDQERPLQLSPDHESPLQLRPDQDSPDQLSPDHDSPDQERPSRPPSGRVPLTDCGYQAVPFQLPPVQPPALSEPP